MNFSDNLKKIRKENNLSQEAIAEKLGVSRQSVSKWESGLAYPEMDKMVKLCQIFNLNIDDLLNQDIKEVNNSKQAKNNINKFIEDFLDYNTKMIDMFSSMKFKQRVKCLFEQIVIIGIITLILIIIGAISSSILGNLFSFIPNNIYYPLYSVFSALYLIICLILGSVLVFHIFKVRYLDYYVIVKDDSDIESLNLEEDKIMGEEEKVYNKIFLEKRQEKIVIRDPEHSGYKFISGLLNCFLFILKMIASFIAIFFCFTIICLVIGLVISFMFVKTGMIFIGSILLIISFVVINIIILNILYNFIVSNKIKKSRLAFGFVISLMLLGLGIGLCMVGVTEFDVISDLDSNYYSEDSQNIIMSDGLFFEDYYGDIDYVESNNEDIKIVIKKSSFYDVDIRKHQNGYYFEYYSVPDNVMDKIRMVIDDLNDKKIVDYGNYKITIYTTKENINILKENKLKYYEQENELRKQEIINEYENRIRDLEYKLCRLDPESCY